jgi:hypothetical protein
MAGEKETEREKEEDDEICWHLLALMLLPTLSHTTMLLAKFLHSSVDTRTGLGLDCRDSIPGRIKGYFYTPLHPDRLWGFLSNVTDTRGMLAVGKASGT